MRRRIGLAFFLAVAVTAGSAADDKQKAAPSRKGPLTAHVLDTAVGKPARGVKVRLERQTDTGWVELGKGKTDDDGRIGDLYPRDRRLETGVYRLIFETGAYFRAQKQKTFFPRVEVIFEVEKADEHYHVPLLLSPYGYSTYRGS
jgi:5-hydroxyisourate hydrolase